MWKWPPGSAETRAYVYVMVCLMVDQALLFSGSVIGVLVVEKVDLALEYMSQTQAAEIPNA